ncbi:MAG: Na(+)/H(+) antiporter NhaA [Gemmatales bacterium]|nr:MAG: Na(+)/H(+) antiporter NhaA [Gemmatales bacterium]
MANDASSSDVPRLPREPIRLVVDPFLRFLHFETASGIVLIVATLAALVLANSAVADAFAAFWKTPIGIQVGAFRMQHSLRHWINDGLMTIFFFVIGLEVKREVVLGELREFRRAILPVVAAIGGMVFPAAIYLSLQFGEAGMRGWGIPMATDIAFVVGCMALLGSRVPHSLRVLLLSLAIADDIGAILVIAVGYTESLNLNALLFGFAGIVVISVLARLGARSLAVYSILGVLVWLAFHESGVHATIAGVLIGFMTPAKSYIDQSLFARFLDSAKNVMEDWHAQPNRAQQVRAFRKVTRETISPLEFLEDALHPWSSFVIMPIFALANAGVAFRADDVTAPVSLAVMAGLVVGKPAGIVLLSWATVKLGLAKLPDSLSWGLMGAGGALAGIGFTMALFIAGLALDGHLLETAKVGILAGSVISAVIGMSLLVWLLPKTVPEVPVKEDPIND